MWTYKRSTALAVLSIVFLIVACGSNIESPAQTGTSVTGTGAGTQPAGTSGSQATAQRTGSGDAARGGKTVGLVLSGPVGVNPFLKGIRDGVEKAAKEAGAKTTVIESRDIPSIEGNLRRLVQQDADLVVCNSFQCVDPLNKVAPANPDQKFLIIDAVVDQPNVSSAVFREHESAYLAGAEAAMVTKSKNLGFVGAMDIPLLHRWSEGYAAGAKHIDPNVKVQIAWTGSFEDVAKTKELATIQANKGADVIFPAAAAGIFGAFEAAKDKGFKTIGVDVDYREQYPDVVIDSQLKQTDVVTYESVKSFLNEQLQPGAKSYGLKENGVGLASLSNPNEISNKALGPEVISRLKQLREQIISGQIEVNDPLQQPAKGTATP